jgi:hypothetical protein
MTKVRRTVLVVVATLGFATVAGMHRFGLASICPPSSPIRLTGTLIEIRQDDTEVSGDDPILSVVPRVVCLKPRGYSPGERYVEIGDCYDSRFNFGVRMESP